MTAIAQYLGRQGHTFRAACGWLIAAETGLTVFLVWSF